MPNAIRAALALALLLGASTLRAQAPDPEEELPPEVAEAVVDFLNDPRRIRYEGPTRIEAGEVIRGDVAVTEGSLEVAGRVEGSVLVVNGDAHVVAGGAITGDLLVVGGDAAGAEEAVGGEVLVYAPRLRYRRLDGRFVPTLAEMPPADRGSTRAGFLVTTGESYNRVEGLPITLGPRFQTGGSNPLRVHALAVYRTESGFTLDPDWLGYYVRAQQFLGGQRELSVGVTAHSLIEPVEEWHLSDLENALATFLFHEDFRDHYDREGFSAFTTWKRTDSPLSLTGEVRWERHASVGAGSPLTLFENAEPWRAQPLVAEGRLGSLRVQGLYDTRSELWDPAHGWHIRAYLEQAFHSTLERPIAYAASAGVEPAILEPVEYGRFTTGFLDARRYNRLSPEARFNLRLLLGGSLRGTPLPPQRQHALGGEGSMPGYPLFALDCGARAFRVRRSPEEPDPLKRRGEFYPAYGCDAFGLLQAELRGRLDFDLRLDSAPWEDEEGAPVGWDMTPDWVIFTDVGRGWAFEDRPEPGVRVDVGAGLLVDRLGIYLAAPLTGGDGVNVFVRLGPRF